MAHDSKQRWAKSHRHSLTAARKPPVGGGGGGKKQCQRTGKGNSTQLRGLGTEPVPVDWDVGHTWSAAHTPPIWPPSAQRPHTHHVGLGPTGGGGD